MHLFQSSWLFMLSRVFRKKKCRLRLENLTRWSSSYLLLESVKKAYDANDFSEIEFEKRCPIELNTVEIYLQILKPVYLLSISFQNNHSYIADTLPCKNENIFDIFCKYNHVYYYLRPNKNI